MQIEKLIEKLKPTLPAGVHFYDFGDAGAVVPVPDLTSTGTYLTSFMCALVYYSPSSCKRGLSTGETYMYVIEFTHVVGEGPRISVQEKELTDAVIKGCNEITDAVRAKRQAEWEVREKAGLA